MLFMTIKSPVTIQSSYLYSATEESRIFVLGQILKITIWYISNSYCPNDGD